MEIFHKLYGIIYENKEIGDWLMEILKVENLSKIYNLGNEEIKAIDNISFEIKKGEFIALIGASGSGKSTLLHLLGGVDKPTQGKIFLEGQDITNLSEDELAIIRRRKIGIIYQFYNLIQTLNVEENIKLPILLDNKKVNPKRLEAILSVLDMKDRRKFFPDQLSGGQQQRVAIGRSLIYSPLLILADEPTGNLDSKNSDMIVKLFKNLNKKLNQTIIIATHNLEIAKQADRVLELKDGKIISDK